ncbi:UbiA family prenyltransferase [Streptomyces sp. Act143]|uniref:UbiA family prenyltransferase n=1 Tax=Streptomyces sp. Act143 TaxID=2200760 RepID=UPI00215AFDAE|nr:UbiA family prenyltransferase [Streptomyces sp. Act143]
MALNDYADATVDAVERPERPVPSGRIRRRTALAIAGILTAGALTLAAASGGCRSLMGAWAPAAAGWAYDLKLKSTPAGPAAMETPRGPSTSSRVRWPPGADRTPRPGPVPPCCAAPSPPLWSAPTPTP